MDQALHIGAGPSAGFRTVLIRPAAIFREPGHGAGPGAGALKSPEWLMAAKLYRSSRRSGVLGDPFGLFGCGLGRASAGVRAWMHPSSRWWRAAQSAYHLRHADACWPRSGPNSAQRAMSGFDGQRDPRTLRGEVRGHPGRGQAVLNASGGRRAFFAFAVCPQRPAGSAGARFSVRCPLESGPPRRRRFAGSLRPPYAANLHSRLAKHASSALAAVLPLRVGSLYHIARAGLGGSVKTVPEPCGLRDGKPDRRCGICSSRRLKIRCHRHQMRRTMSSAPFSWTAAVRCARWWRTYATAPLLVSLLSASRCSSAAAGRERRSPTQGEPGRWTAGLRR